MAIESAVTLARCLAPESSLSVALRRYEVKRMARTAWITAQSRQIGRVAQFANPLACAVRNFAVSVMPTKLTANRMPKAFDCDL